MPGVGELVVILFILVIVGGGLGLWVWMLVDCITKEAPEGNERLVWILVIVLAGWIGALIYLCYRRPLRKRLLGR
jgi:hypothetical protein